MNHIEGMKLWLEALEVSRPIEQRSVVSQNKHAAAIASLEAAIEQAGPKCNPHPKAPHGFDRNASHSDDRYVCECEGWDAYDAGYQAGFEKGLSMDEQAEQQDVPETGNTDDLTAAYMSGVYDGRKGREAIDVIKLANQAGLCIDANNSGIDDLHAFTALHRAAVIKKAQVTPEELEGLKAAHGIKEQP